MTSKPSADLPQIPHRSLQSVLLESPRFSGRNDRHRMRYRVVCNTVPSVFILQSLILGVPTFFHNIARYCGHDKQDKNHIAACSSSFFIISVSSAKQWTFSLLQRFCQCCRIHNCPQFIRSPLVL